MTLSQEMKSKNLKTILFNRQRRYTTIDINDLAIASSIYLTKIFQDFKKALQRYQFTNGIPSVLVATATAAIILLVLCFVPKPAESKVKGKQRNTILHYLINSICRVCLPRPDGSDQG